MRFFFGGNLVPEYWRLSAGYSSLLAAASVRTQRVLSPGRQLLRVLGGSNARHVHLLPEGASRGGNHDRLFGA